MDMVDIQDWASDKVVTVQISQTVLDAPFTLAFRRFIPADGDSTTRSWWDGSQWQRYPMPPYAIANMAEAAISYSMMIDKNIKEYVNVTVFGHDGWIKMTYDSALEQLYDERTVSICIYLFSDRAFRFDSLFTELILLLV